MKLFKSFIAVSCVVAALAACDGINNECLDGIDNDGDGRVDADDPACSPDSAAFQKRQAACLATQSGIAYDSPACSAQQVAAKESDDPACADGKDNDGDGVADYPNDVGCDSLTDTDERNGPCADGLDNDGDGRIDEQDVGCYAGDSSVTAVYNPRGLTELSTRACSDGADNDLDTQIDFPADPQCSDPFDNNEGAPECSDGIDNDGDGRADFGGANADRDCETAAQDRERAFQCGDGADNDGDGASDWPQDPDCENIWDDNELSENECTDGRDNDFDNRIDAADPGCVVNGAEGLDPECSDGIDNDGDGQADMQDTGGCTDAYDNSEANDECSDGRDNNNNGLIDAEDPYCRVAGATAEGLPACGDRIDNDGDGLIDALDPQCNGSTTGSAESRGIGDCTDGKDNDNDGATDRRTRNGANRGDAACNAGFIFESLTPPQCSDGLDNDGDTLIDWPSDPGCTNAWDNDEVDLVP